MSSIGAPEPPKPPIITVAPSPIPATASAKPAIVLFIGTPVSSGSAQAAFSTDKYGRRSIDSKRFVR
jgi:hypothetical protein